MNIQEFGQTIKQKYPQYQDIPDEELGNKVIQKYPQYKDMVTTAPETNPVVSALHALGGGWITDTTGLAQQPGRMITGQKDNPFFTKEQQQGMQTNPLGTIASSAGSDILSALGTMLSVGGLAKVAPYATYKGLAGMTNKAAQAGSDIPWSSVEDLAKKGIKGSGLRQAIGELSAQYAPSGMGEAPITSEGALAIRREIAKRYGPSIFDWFTGSSDTKMAAAQIRNALSTLLHEAAPGTVTPDKLYTAYKAGGPILSGDIPSKLLKLGVGIPAVRSMLGPVLGRMVSSITHE